MKAIRTGIVGAKSDGLICAGATGLCAIGVDVADCWVRGGSRCLPVASGSAHPPYQAGCTRRDRRQTKEGRECGLKLPCADDIRTGPAQKASRSDRAVTEFHNGRPESAESGGNIHEREPHPFSLSYRHCRRTTPFVGPEALERTRGGPFAVRLGANESAFGISPKAAAAIERELARASWYGDPESYELREELATSTAFRWTKSALARGSTTCSASSCA